MRRLIEFLIRNPIWSWAFIILTIAVGTVSYLGLRKSFFPEIDSRVVNIQVAMPGASPEEMEEGVTLKVEEALEGIQGVEKITSTSIENFATVNVEIERGFDVDEALTDVKNAVDGISSFPVDAEQPTVFVRKSQQTAITMVLSGHVDLMTLKRYAESVEDDLLRSPLISQVSIFGIPDREISIEVSEVQLLRYGMTFDEVANAVSINNRDISGGVIETDVEEFIIRSDAKSTQAAEIESIIIRSDDDGAVVRLRDIATVREQFADVPDKTLFNDRNAVTINVDKLVSEDMVRITDHVKDYVEDFNATHDGLRLSVTRDSSVSLKQRIEMLYKNGAIGLCLVVLALGFFMSTRLSVWVAAGIPLSFLGMFFIVSNFGVTINMISVFGMILVIGILVDDGIVIAENIYTHFERGKSRVQAAVDGSLEVFPAVFVSVSTTMLVFSAIFFFEDRLGDFLREMAFVVIGSLFFSLIEATVVLPSHLAHSRALVRKERQGALRARVDRFIDWMRHTLYGRVLHRSLEGRYTSAALVVAFILFVMGLQNGGFIQRTQFPPIGSDDFDVSLVLTPGTNDTITEAVLLDISETVWQVNDSLSAGRSDGLDIVESVMVRLGQASNENGSHTGTISVELLDGETRNVPDYVITQHVRARLDGRIPGLQKLTVGSTGFFGKPIAINLTSTDFESLKGAKRFIQDELGKMESVKDITDNDIMGRKEIRIRLRPKAYALGFNHGEIARQIRQGFFGEEIQRLQAGTDEIKVWVRYPKDERERLGDLDAMRVKGPDGTAYLLSDLVDYTIERGIVNINHYNGAREISIEADLADQSEALDPIIAFISSDIMPEMERRFPTVEWMYEGQFEQGARLMSSILQVMPVILLMILILLTLVFRSPSQALMVLSLVGVGYYCAVLGHGIETVLTDWRSKTLGGIFPGFKIAIPKPVSNLSFYGVIALAGIIINDAVVFLEKYNQHLVGGRSVYNAAKGAGLARFRAIMLTSVTTVFGLYPLIFETSIQAQFLIPMAISVAYGVLFGTAVILINFPAIILIVNDVRRIWKWLRIATLHGVSYWPSREEVEPRVRERVRLAMEGYLDDDDRAAIEDRFNRRHASGLNVLETFPGAANRLSHSDIQLR